MEVKGRDLVSGIPKIVRVHSSEIREAVQEPFNRSSTRCVAPSRYAAELASDIVGSRHRHDRGGALIRARSAAAAETGLPIHLDETHDLRGAWRGGSSIRRKYRNVLTT